MAFYSAPAHWNERYQWATDEDVLEDTFDWYVPYGIRTSDGVTFAEGLGLRDELLSLFPRKQRGSLKVLIIGCGTSTMGEMMHDDGFRDILCVDFAERCISRMTRRQGLLAHTMSPVSSSLDGVVHSAPPALREPVVRDGLRYECVDAQSLSDHVAPGSIDVVIDKAMLDASFCDNDVQRRYDRIAKVLEGVYDVLRPNGTYMHISSSNETGGARGVVFRNPVLPWSNVSVVKLDLGSAASSGKDGGSAAASAIAANDEAAEFFAKPYWMFCLVK